MILILLSWIYMVFTTINIGFYTGKTAEIKNSDFVIYSILGLFTTTLLAGFWAIFGRINIEFHVFLLVLNIGIYVRFKNEIHLIYKSLFQELQALTLSLKAIFFSTTLLILAQCASIPYIIDNESYYIQTIKWINEYGFVKGLANLHIFLAQTSGWHIAQSVFSFSFLYPNFNDLSGFFLLLGNIYAFRHLNAYFKNKESNHLIIGLLPLANIFFFSFISTPSPDLPIYILSLILFFKFIENYKNPDTETFNLIALLVFFAVFIKTTSIVLVLIPMVLFVKDYKVLLPKLAKPVLIGLVVLVLFLIKNTIISGYPLFPALTSPFSFDFQIPSAMAHFYYDETKTAAFSLTETQFDSLGIFEIFKIWIFRPGLHGLFNTLVLVLLVITPVFIFKFFNKKPFWILYAILFFQMIVLFVSSPQYRFFMNAILLFTFLIAATLLRSQRKIVISLYFATGILITILMIPFNLSVLTTNVHLKNNSTFSVNEIIFPHQNSKFDFDYQSIKNGNLQYQSPLNNTFFWGTGNGKLPCVNKDQLKYFEVYYKIIPQMRTTNLKDGFYAKNISNESN
ncbi:hypothetical protein [Flavobacterium sp. ENC]|uniref:LIC_10190 family membrane protein n=1 Tax=Flavobacterium sp. ENC TaxID=2897330 RepID=UPI001E3F8632|nr:hypothetical protein [Flavobacterium sp. ENC]MCD0466389.1 hypothetical protein [Flavobacterium sp. ENC]